MTPPTRLYLVRHGATQLTAEDRFAGAVGVDLSDEGRRAGRSASALRLADDAIKAVYCSPLSPHRRDRARSWRSRTASRPSTATGCARSATAAGRG